MRVRATDFDHRRELQPTFKRYLIPCLWSAAIASCAMVLFETTKQFFVPAITIWQSHAATIVFVTIVATAVTALDCWRWNRAGHRIRQSEAEFRALFGAVNDALFILGLSGRILVANSIACQSLGYSQSELMGMSIAQITNEDEEFSRERLSAILARGKGLFETSHVRKDGSVFPVEVSIRRFRFRGETAELCLVRDISQRRQAEEILLQSEKLASVGRMAASIAHEINNPLAAVTNTVFLAKLNLEKPASARHYLETAEEELRRVSHITQQTLGFYREFGTPTTVSINSVMDSAVNLLRDKIISKKATIRKQYNGEILAVVVPGELRQVFSNLLVNSLDAIDLKGSIRLRVSRSTCLKSGELLIRVTVADNGRGIDTTALPRIFEPLFTTKKLTGTGLGLWVSKQIIEKHGGSIRVRSSVNPSRRGTVFSVLIPAAGVEVSAERDRSEQGDDSAATIA